jgi:FkbM family methyltransferase
MMNTFYFIESWFGKLEQLSNGSYRYDNYYLPINHFEPQIFYEKYGLEKHVSVDKIKDRVILDVGAYIGDSALIFEEYTTNKIYAFEPQPENYNMMLETIKLNNAKRIVPVNLGLGEKEETLGISGSSSGSRIDPDSLCKVKITTLDNWVKSEGIENIGMIKVDVEGFEMPFLKGAQETIKTHAPVLLLSIYHNAHDFFELKPYMESLGVYSSFKLYKPLNFSIHMETLLICQ